MFAAESVDDGELAIMGMRKHDSLLAYVEGIAHAQCRKVADGQSK
jgi:uncharacterized protein